MNSGYKFTKTLVFLLMILFIKNNLYAEASQEWDTYFGNSVVPKAMVADKDGNTYVAGYGFTSGQGYNFVTVKFNSGGTKVWDVKFNGPSNKDDYAYGIEQDNVGNTYVYGVLSSGTGNTTYEIALVKYNNAGEEQWSAIFNGEGNGFDSPKALVTDASGNVYVTGISMNANGNTDFVTIKYNADGEEQWKTFYNGPGNNTDESNAVTLDNQNNVIVTGRSRSGSFSSSNDFATIKYNNNGQEQWVTRYNGTGSDYDEGVSIAADVSGNIFVTGISTGNGTLYDFTTIKYNSSGQEQWAKRYNGDANREDIPVKLLLDNAGNVCIAGSSRKTNSLGSEDYATVKYNSSGDELWVKRFDGNVSEKDMVADMVIDNSNNIYVTGFTQTGPGAVDKDIYTIKYSSDGNQDWAIFYNNSDSTGDEPVSIGIDNSGSVYVAGVSKQAYLVVKYG